MYPGGPPPPQRRSADDKEWVEPFDPAKGNYVSESGMTTQSATTADGWQVHGPNRDDAPRAGAQKDRPSLYPPKPNVQPEADAARLRAEAARMRHAADAAAAQEKEAAADAIRSMDLPAIPAQPPRWEAEEAEAAARGVQPPAIAGAGQVDDDSEEEIDSGLIGSRIGKVAAQGRGESWVEPPSVTSNDLDSMEERMRSLQETIDQQPSPRAAAAAAVMGSDSDSEAGELSMLSAASGPSPAKGPLATKARAAAAAMDLDSSAETAAADESFGLAALKRRGSGVDRSLEGSLTSDADDGRGDLAVKVDDSSEGDSDDEIYRQMRNRDAL